MAILGAPTIQAVRWDGRRLSLLDQTLLPGVEAWVTPEGAAGVAEAIARLVVRGAPNIGIAAAYGVAMSLSGAAVVLGALEEACEVLIAARPTAVNLAWAVERVRAACLGAGPSTLAGAARGEAQKIHASEDAASLAMASLGADWLDGRAARRRRPRTPNPVRRRICGSDQQIRSISARVSVRVTPA